MNILPKKKWHVRTKDNIARVRRDEAKAADEERRTKERAALAEQEHRTKILRERAAQRNETVFGVRPAVADQSSPVIAPNDSAGSFPGPTEVSIDHSGHVNFFAELEADERKNLGTTNEEYEKEKKQEKEAEEKKIGLLKYLGEGSAEYTKEVPWYQRVPEKPSSSSSIPSTSSSSILDKKPTADRKQLVGIVALDYRPPTAVGQIVTPSDLKVAKRKRRKEKKKRKKEKKSSKKRRRHRSRSPSPSSSSSSSSESDAEQPKADLAQLRAERLRREANERAKADAVIRKARGLPEPPPVAETKPVYKQRYNSQFNPEMAKQNRVD